MNNSLEEDYDADNEAQTKKYRREGKLEGDIRYDSLGYKNSFEAIADKYGVKDYLPSMILTLKAVYNELQVSGDNDANLKDIIKQENYYMNQGRGSRGNKETASLIAKIIMSLQPDKLEIFGQQFIYQLQRLTKREQTFYGKNGGKTKKRRVNKQQLRKSKYRSSKVRRRSGKSRRRQ